MGIRTRNLITGLSAILVGSALLISFLPTLLENYFPHEYWYLLPDRVIATMGQRDEFAATVADVNVDANANELFNSELILAPTEEPTQAPTAIPTATAVPTEAAVIAQESEEVGVIEEATATPTAIPPTATPSPTPIPPTATPVVLPTSFQLTGLTNEAQKFNNCGPTNMSIVLNYWGDDTDQLTAASILKPNYYDRNVSPWQISDYVNTETQLKSITRVGGDQALLKQLVVAGYPVVIEKGYDPNVENAYGWYGHYLTVFGYSDEQEEFYTMDTFLGPFVASDALAGYTLEDGRPYSYEYIDFYWQQFAYTFYVVYPPSREAELMGILGPDLTDNVQMWANSAARAQAEIDADPTNAFSWFNLGTALTQLGEITGEQTYYENGALAFDQSLGIGLPSRMLWYQHRPYIAYMKIGRYQDMLDLADSTLVDPGGRQVEETYYYRGHALSFLGDLNGSAESFEQALELNETFYPAQFALDYVNSIR